MSTTRSVLHFNNNFNDNGSPGAIWTPSGSPSFIPGVFSEAIQIYIGDNVSRSPGSDLDIGHKDFCIECRVKFTPETSWPWSGTILPYDYWMIPLGGTYALASGQAPAPNPGPIYDGDTSTWSGVPGGTGISAAFNLPLPPHYGGFITAGYRIYNYSGSVFSIVWNYSTIPLNGGLPWMGWLETGGMGPGGMWNNPCDLIAGPFGGQISEIQGRFTYWYTGNPQEYIIWRTGSAGNQMMLGLVRSESYGNDLAWFVRIDYPSAAVRTCAIIHGNPPIVGNTWYHMVVSRRNGALTIYQDGVALKDFGGGTSSPWNFSIPHMSSDWYAPRGYDGGMDEFIISIGDWRDHDTPAGTPADPTVARLPSSIDITCRYGENAVDELFEVWNSTPYAGEGSLCLYYDLSKDVSWLKFVDLSDSAKIVDGTDGHKYRCILSHTAPSGSNPIDITKDIEMLEYDGAWGRVIVTWTSHFLSPGNTVKFDGITQTGWNAINGTQVVAGYGSPAQHKFYFYVPDTWLPNTSYSVGDFVWFEGYYFTCNTDHTSDPANFWNDYYLVYPDWTPNTSYSVGDKVSWITGGPSFSCNTSHTSDPVDFWNDYALGYWTDLYGYWTDDSPAPYVPATDPGKCTSWMNFWRRTSDSVSSLTWTEGVVYAPCYIDIITYGTSEGEHDVFGLGIDSSGLAVGGYTGTVTITGDYADNSPQTILVNLTIISPAIPEIEVAPTSLTPYCYEGGDAASDSFEIRNVGNAASILNYTITDDSGGWIASCVPSSGSLGWDESDTITVNYNTAGLSVGVYTARIRIEDIWAANSPQYVDVTLNVYPPTEAMLMRHLKWFWDRFMGCYLKSR